ncbi:hypothetical protein [Pseudotabrizicola sp. L79]|uniref:hypothetical protein n=1 Tax=Pseudotabrizicola sp. L79 TaxID=3118402 RepID=UPI002F93F34C
MTSDVFSTRSQFYSRSLPAARRTPVRGLLMALTVGVTALGLMLASALPARADKAGDDLAKALVAAIALGAIIHSLDDDKANANAKGPLPSRHGLAPRLPANCAVDIMGKRRAVTVYPARCLTRSRFEGRLPRHCAFDARINGRMARVYGEDCLLDAGFRVEGRRGGGHGYDDRRRDSHRGYDDDRPRRDRY